MPRLIACSSCGAHHHASDAVCPHCGAMSRRDVVTGAAALLGLAACDDTPTQTSQADYAASDTTTTEPETETGDTGTM